MKIVHSVFGGEVFFNDNRILELFMSVSNLELVAKTITNKIIHLVGKYTLPNIHIELKGVGGVSKKLLSILGSNNIKVIQI